MARLRRGVYYGVRCNVPHHRKYALSVPDVHLVMSESRQGLLESLLIPASISFGTKQYRPLIIVDSVDIPATLGKIFTDLRADQPG